jgi:hypothetical protein
MTLFAIREPGAGFKLWKCFTTPNEEKGYIHIPNIVDARPHLI